ncbi:MAG: archease [Actinomycetota bacterium]
MRGFEIIEHTADVGIRAHGATLEELFEQAARGLFDILDAWHPGAGEDVRVELEPSDRAGALVDWLNELLFIQETRDIVFTDLRVGKVEGGLDASVRVRPRAGTLEGTAVKAATWHQLEVEPDEAGWRARVYLDV